MAKTREGAKEGPQSINDTMLELPHASPLFFSSNLMIHKSTLAKEEYKAWPHTHILGFHRDYIFLLFIIRAN
jgi:hypothetical protein